MEKNEIFGKGRGSLSWGNGEEEHEDTGMMNYSLSLAQWPINFWAGWPINSLMEWPIGLSI